MIQRINDASPGPPRSLLFCVGLRGEAEADFKELVAFVDANKAW